MLLSELESKLALLKERFGDGPIKVWWDEKYREIGEVAMLTDCRGSFHFIKAKVLDVDYLKGASDTIDKLMPLFRLVEELSRVASKEESWSVEKVGRVTEVVETTRKLLKELEDRQSEWFGKTYGGGE